MKLKPLGARGLVKKAEGEEKPALTPYCASNAALRPQQRLTRYGLTPSLLIAGPFEPASAVAGSIKSRSTSIMSTSTKVTVTVSRAIKSINTPHQAMVSRSTASPMEHEKAAHQPAAKLPPPDFS